MAAPTLSLKQQKRAIKKKGPTQKNVVWNPCVTTWPVLPEDKTEAVLEKIKSTFSPLYLVFPKLPWIRGKNKAEKRKEAAERAKQMTEEEKQLRGQLVMGINAVTRHLEKGKLRLVVADRSCMPSHLTKHLVQLAAVQSCPAVCLPGLFSVLAKPLGLKSLVAVGFKKLLKDDLPHFNELVDFISKNSPEIKVPWLPTTVDRSEGNKSPRSDMDQNEHMLVQSSSQVKNSFPESVESQISPPPSSSSVKHDLFYTLDLVDYSYLYIYKGASRARKVKKQDFGADYLGFSKDSENSEEEISGIETKTLNQEKRKGKKRKLVSSEKTVWKKGKSEQEDAGQFRYQTVKLGKMQGNRNRAETKKKKSLKHRM